MEIKKHLDLLGLKVKDKVTGFCGVIDSISFDLYGCVQASINPGTDKDGKRQDGYWFDVKRLRVTGKKPVMEIPNFDYGVQAEGKQGPSNKPMRDQRAPIR